MVTYRPARISDLPAIREIYNEAVLNGTATFDTELRSTERQEEWFRAHGSNHPVLVAELEDTVAGWASLSPWSERKAYDRTVEVSVYVHHSHRGKGIGSRLLELVTLEGEKCGNHTILSRITEGNEVSIHLHEKNGYRIVGTLKECGFKFGRYLDVVLMQKVFSS
jgi:phosphinothricin acetyltransferase